MSPERAHIVVYGGTFDPFHQGHAAICDKILSSARVETLQVVPCHIPPLKNEAIATSQQRLGMLKEWRQNHPQSDRLVINSMEIDREGPSYTIDTVKSLKASYPGQTLLFALGADAWNSLEKWHKADELVQLVSFWVFAREGADVIKPNAQVQAVPDFASLFDHGAGVYWKDHSVRFDISSTKIREASEQFTQKLPAEVAGYIQDSGIYKA